MKKHILVSLLAVAGLAVAASIDQKVKAVAGSDNPSVDAVQSVSAYALTDKNGNVKVNAYSGTVTISSATLNAPAIVGDAVQAGDATGGNLGATSTITGIVNAAMIPFATMTDGTASTKTKALMDDTPAGEWSAIGGGTADPTPANDATIARIGSNSLKLPFTDAAVAGDGAKFTAFSSENWEAQESVGLWVRSSIVLVAGDVCLKTVDSTGDVSFDMPAVSTVNKWQWVEFDISGLTGGTGDAVTNVKLALSTAGAAKGAFNLWIDGAYKWDATEELTLGVDLIDGPGTVRSVLGITKANTGTHDMTALVENTDYFVHRESGNDFLVTITNQSARAAFALVMHK
jgi:hypothetical protein